ncbi:MAG: biotin transporter BioY [Candidatus Heteroscillospira sp.]|jgi:biotin transport system substrate-specific component
MNSKAKSRSREAAYIALMTALIAICAWISIPTAVPFTMQTFAVFVAAGLLGAKRSALAIIVYMLLGAAGLPVFNGMQGGMGILLGKTGGYIVGFIFLALIEGWTAQKFRGNSAALFVSMLLGTAVCYAFGTVWFMQVYMSSTGAVGLMTVLGWCVFPFIIPDICKMLLALVVIRRVSPQLRLD